MQFTLVGQGTAARCQNRVHIDVKLPVQLSWKVMDYIPFLSMISGIAHMALAMMAMTALPFVLIADLVTLGRYNLTFKAHLLTSFEMIRGVLCFLPFIGNGILYNMDHPPSGHS